MKRLMIALVVGLVLTVAATVASAYGSINEIKQNTLRVHIIANSDSKEDQEVKLLVRDAVLEQLEPLVKGAKTALEAQDIVKENLDGISETASEVLAENGFEYEALASLESARFPTREYEQFVLPAGDYNALLVKLGSAKGGNYWCVLYPFLCHPSAGGESAAAVIDSNYGTKDGALIKKERPLRVELKFKILEILGKDFSIIP